MNEILLSVNQLGQRIKALKQIDEQISRLQKTEPALLALPQVHPAVEKIRQDLKDPSRAEDSKNSSGPRCDSLPGTGLTR